MINPLRILVVDDQALVRAGFVVLINAAADLTVVGEADNGAEAVALARRLDPDVVLMDVRMPVMDGIAATAAICAAESPTTARVLMLTTFDHDEHVHAALRAGASGFLLKDAPPTDLLDAIRVVAAGEALLAPTVTRRLIEDFRRQPNPTVNAVGLTRLTSREREVLGLIAKGLSNAEIAAHLVVGHATVKTHVGRILMKLHARDRAQLVMVAYESGLVTVREA